MIRLTELHGGRAGSAAVRWDQRSVDVLSVVQTARTLRAQFIADHLHSALTAFGRWSGLTKLAGWLHRQAARRRTVAELSAMSDEMLADIGIARAEIRAVAAAVAAEQPVATHDEAAEMGAEAPADLPVTAQVLAFIEVRRSAQQAAGDAAHRNVNRPAA